MYVIRKTNIWKSLLFNLAISNIVMVVAWAIQTAFGYTPNYWYSLVITNVVTLLFWLFRTFASDKDW